MSKSRKLPAKRQRSMKTWVNSLSEQDRAELDQLIAARKSRTSPAEVRLVDKPGRRPAIEPGKSPGSELMATLKLERAFAGLSLAVPRVRMGELLGYLHAAGVVDEDQINAAINFVESMEPQDQGEALLLVQMYVTHRAAIRALGLMEVADHAPSLQNFGNLAVKLLRTAQGQMDTLARMRRGGEQVVRHIHVNQGGQAVIADEFHHHAGGPGNERAADQPFGAGEFARSAALPGPDAARDGVPIPGHAERPLQAARRKEPGRSEGQ